MNHLLALQISAAMYGVVAGILTGLAVPWFCRVWRGTSAHVDRLADPTPLYESEGPDLPDAGHDIDALARLVNEDRAHLRVIDQMDPRWLRRRLAAQEPRPCPPTCPCHVDTTPDGVA